MNLSARRRELIELEEQYRLDVRTKLEAALKKPETRLDRLLMFCNSGVGLFLLSTVFVSAFSFIFSWATAHHAASKEGVERERRIRLEIANRLEDISLLGTRFRAEYHDVVKTAIYGFRVGETQNASYKLFYAAMFPEFRDRSLESLFRELEDLSQRDKKPSAEAARKHVKLLAAYLYKLIPQNDPAPPGSSDPLEFFTLSDADRKSFAAELSQFAGFVTVPER